MYIDFFFIISYNSHKANAKNVTIYGDFGMRNSRLFDYCFDLESINMEILESGDVCLGTWWKADKIASPFTRVYMVTDGIGYLEFNGETITMTEGNIYVIPAGMLFSYHCNDGFRKVYFHLSIRLKNGYDIFEGINKCFSFSDTDTASLIKNSLTADSVTKIIQIKAHLYSLVYQCIAYEKNLKIERYSDFISEILDFIDQNLSAQLTVEEISNRLFTSPTKVRKAFKKEIGISIGKHIDNRLMIKAESEVRQGNLPISEISKSLGFCDQFYFSRCFSQKYGIPPLHYRKIHNRLEK